ncbi:MAG: EamA family transporter [Acidimicrobiia bacterium]|nr:EamA family transporter [Acidimicrobiia bacterium]
MTLRQIFFLSAFALLLSIGQVLFKQASESLTNGSGPGGFLSLLESGSFWAAIALYGGSTLLWIWLIREVPLSRAYPFVALAFVVVPILSHFVLDERISRAGVAGSALIVLGIVVSQV